MVSGLIFWGGIWLPGRSVDADGADIVREMILWCRRFCFTCVFPEKMLSRNCFWGLSIRNFEGE